MAKSARASGVKKNKQNLKKKVFGPVETARNDRLSAKLLELASQPKPPKAEMDVEQDGMRQDIYTILRPCLANIPLRTDAKDTTDPEAKDKATGGVSTSLSISIPASLLHSNAQNLPSPPATPTNQPATHAIPDMPAQKALAKGLLFHHLLGASTDIIGFDENGDLQLSFAASI